MIRAYDEYYLDMARDKLGCMFELAVYIEHMDVDTFAERFLQSSLSKAIEKGDPVYLAGKSADELLALILHKEPEEHEMNMYASPEYWLGYQLAYIQWYLNKPFSEIIKAYKASQLLADYFPYHEMDETKIIELIKSHLNNECPLKTWRKKRNLSQSELSRISGVPLRTIKAYEQKKLDITKAQADTLYILSRTLDCSMEELIG